MARSIVPRISVRAALEECYARGPELLVVSGPPCCGKSTAVSSWCAQLEIPTLRVLLTDVADGPAFIEQVAVALGAAVEPVDEDTVGHALRARDDLLVVLDDFDRLVGTAESVLERWRVVAPRTRWVITSRQRPQLPDAQFVHIGPMTRDEALALFETRARGVRPDFAFDDELESIVGELAEELDFIPLAIELAAARVNTLGPAEILKRLGQRFRILRGGATTLQGAFELSWEMLDEWEREALAQSAVFRGGFDASAAEDVIELGGNAPWIVDVLEALVAKSLLRSHAPDALVGEVRFEMLTSIREFVAARQPTDASVSSRHASYYLRCCREWTHQMRREGGAVARARLELEQRNLLAAFEVADLEPSHVVELALTLDKWFRLRGAQDNWEAVLDRARGLAAATDLAHRALVFRALGELHLLRGKFDEAVQQLARAADAAERAEQWVTLAWTWFLRGEVERRRGNVAAALIHLESAIELAREHAISNVERMALGHQAGCLVDLGRRAEARAALDAMRRLPPSDDLRDEANLLKRVAYAQHYLGNTDEQIRLTAEALELAREVGDRRLEAICIQGLGDAKFVQGKFTAARDAWVEALALHRAHGSVELEGALLGNLGNLEHRLSHLDEARSAYRAALELHALTGAKPYEAVAWFGLGVLELEQRHLEDAAAALQRAAELNEAIGNTSDLASCQLVGAWVAEARGLSSAELRASARQAFEAAGDADWAVLCDPDARAADVEDETVRACLSALDGGEPHDRSGLHVRAALACRADERPVPDAAVLRVAADGTWFETGGERVDMRRRRAPRHLLARLVELRKQDPGAAIDVEEAFEVGWPGEIATVEAANDRVYWAIRTLRKLGLEGFLLTSGEGYLLDPQTTTVAD